MIILTLENQHGKLGGNVSPALEDEISHICSYWVQNAEKSDLYKKRRWDGYKKLYNRQKKTFPMGLLEYIIETLEKHNIKYKIEDNRSQSIAGGLDIHLKEDVKIRDYQIDAIETGIMKGRCVLQIATGGGKTVIASGIIDRLKSNTLFIVHTKDLMYQTIDSFNDFLDHDDLVGQLGDGVIDVKPITVCTVQTLSKVLGLKFEKMVNDDSNFKEKKISDIKEARAAVSKMEVVIWDEVHRVACDMAYNVSEKLTNPLIRIGLSASAWRDDGADIMIEAALGRKAYYLSASDLIERGFLTQPIIKMQYMKPQGYNSYGDDRKYDTIYKEEITDNQKRNELIADTFVDLVGMGIPTMILVQHIKHGRELKRLIEDRWDKITFLSGSDLSEVRNSTISQMKEGMMGLIATTIADEGLDIKRLGGLILAGGGKSSTRALQRVGRVLRPYEGKDNAIVIDFFDDIKYLNNHANKRMEIYKSEKNFIVLKTQ